MPPESTSTITASGVRNEEPELIHRPTSKKDGKASSKPTKELDPRLYDIHSDYVPPIEIVWRNVALFVYLHTAAAIGLYFLFTGQVQWRTVLWTCTWHLFGALGITAGAHRLYAHKSYKAKLPLRIIMTFMQTVSFQNSIWEWARDHRVHHKYSETHADPHNAKRGFFFAHMGWLMCKKHPMVREKGKLLDVSDLEADPLIMWQKKYYLPIVLVVSFFIPALGPWFFWGESFVVAWCFAAQLRYCFNLHCTWLVNSAAHMWGNRPYDQTISPAENKTVAIWAFGEGWHNYHHTFPWDYKTSELGNYEFNFTTAFIDFFAWLGWAHDLKTVSHKVIEDRCKRTGDGSHLIFKALENHHHEEDAPWGWGDKDIPKERIEVTQSIYSEGENKKD